MSYFGNEGPAQDGGFLAGIGRGQQRLQGARAKRMSHAKAMGFGAVEKAKTSTIGRWWQQVEEDGLTRATVNALEEDSPDPMAISAAANRYHEAREDFKKAKANLVNAPEGASEEDKANLNRLYNESKKLMFKRQQEYNGLISSGPHVREYKVYGMGLVTVAVGLGATWWFYHNIYRPTERISGSKSAMYAVFS